MAGQGDGDADEVLRRAIIEDQGPPMAWPVMPTWTSGTSGVTRCPQAASRSRRHPGRSRRSASRSASASVERPGGGRSGRVESGRGGCLGGEGLEGRWGDERRVCCARSDDMLCDDGRDSMEDSQAGSTLPPGRRVEAIRPVHDMVPVSQGGLGRRRQSLSEPIVQEIERKVSPGKVLLVSRRGEFVSLSSQVGSRLRPHSDHPLFGRSQRIGRNRCFRVFAKSASREGSKPPPRDVI